MNISNLNDIRAKLNNHCTQSLVTRKLNRHVSRQHEGRIAPLGELKKIKRVWFVSNTLLESALLPEPKSKR